jgi:hypothetical protein
VALEYKFVELSIVTDETLEEAVNAWVGRGWVFDGIRFVTTEASRRPSLAFITFTREVTREPRSDAGPGPKPEPEPARDEPEQRGPRLVKADPDDERA